MNTRTARRAFTLIELMIVTVIIPISVAATFKLISALEDSSSHLTARADAHEAAAALQARWCNDVQLAARVEVADDGRTMTIAKVDGQAHEYTVAYGAPPSGAEQTLPPAVQGEVQVKPAPPAPTAPQNGELRFSRVGRGYRMDLMTTYQDGIRTWRWPETAFATPLAPQEAL